MIDDIESFMHKSQYDTGASEIIPANPVQLVREWSKSYA